jgi:hypothetical protein
MTAESVTGPAGDASRRRLDDKTWAALAARAWKLSDRDGMSLRRIADLFTDEG